MTETDFMAKALEIARGIVATGTSSTPEEKERTARDIKKMFDILTGERDD